MSFDNHQAQVAYAKVQQRLLAKSATLLMSIESRLPRIMMVWFGIAMFACAVRIVTSPIHAAPDLSTFLPYMLLVGAPLVSMGLALHWFENGDRLPQPSARLALYGRWRKVDLAEA